MKQSRKVDRSTMRQRTELFLVLSLIALGVALRFTPHPANVAPIAALGLFSGVYLKRRYAIIVPLVAMMISDIFLGFHSTIPFTWGSFVLVGVIGWQLQQRKTASKIVVGSLAGSILFYVITNFGVWATTSIYPKTIEGLGLSYVMAIPFFRNTVLGDLFFTGVFFGLYELTALAIKRRTAIPTHI